MCHVPYAMTYHAYVLHTMPTCLRHAVLGCVVFPRSFDPTWFMARALSYPHRT